MAILHIAFNQNTPHGSQLRSALSNLETGLELLNDIFSTLNLMRDGSTITQYIVDKFGFSDIATASAAYDELNSLQAKLNTNSSITDVNAALLQAFNKFR